MKYLIVGGQERENAIAGDNHFAYAKGKVVVFDEETRTCKDFIDYVSPQQYLPGEGGSICFTAASVHKNRLYCCTRTEVLVYDIKELTLLLHFSHPLMNDVHHVDFKDGVIYVVATGVDGVLKFNEQGEFIEFVNVVEGYDVIERFGNVDFRKLPTTKPHKVHPNFVTLGVDSVFVTQFHSHKIFNMLDPSDSFEISTNRMHDGHYENGKGYYTCVDGKVVVVDYSSKSEEVIHEFANLESTIMHHGWCRGLSKTSDNQFIIGFSRLRPTKNVLNISWIKDFKKNLRLTACLPTRISKYDFNSNQVIWSFNLEEVGVNVVYSILPLDEN
jgi:hypothetical protein